MIWLIGNKGMLGSEVERILKEHGDSYVATDRELDITAYQGLRDFAETKPIEYIINCSAYTAVDKAEDEADAAEAINVLGVENIARVARQNDAVLIHISTDYVFSGDKNAPYLEEDTIHPLGVYGKTKAAGEEKIKELCSKCFILRTSWLYGKNGKNFVTTMLRLMNTKGELGVVSDQWGSPTYAVDLAQCVLTITREGFDQYGVYHFANHGTTNWYLFAEMIYRLGKDLGLVNSPCVIKKLTTDDYPTPAKRPVFSVLSTNKIKEAFDCKILPWETSLTHFLKELKNA